MLRSRKAMKKLSGVVKKEKLDKSEN